MSSPENQNPFSKFSQYIKWKKLGILPEEYQIQPSYDISMRPQLPEMYLDRLRTSLPSMSQSIRRQMLLSIDDIASSSPIQQEMDRQDGKPLIVVNSVDSSFLKTLTHMLAKDLPYAALLPAGDSGIMTLTSTILFRPHLVITDATLTDIDGFELISTLNTLRADNALPHTQSIFVTARDSRSDQAHGLSLGALEYFTIPVKIQNLVQYVDGLLAPPAI